MPVYRVEKTLDFCLESILRQKFRDFEVLLIDDGSPDYCPRMCDEWARRDSRIMAIHKDNGGLSSARNAGIDRARGQLLMFVDSDDSIAPDTIEPLVELMDAHPCADIIEFPVCRLSLSALGDRMKPLVSFPAPYQEFADIRQYWFESKTYLHTYAWNKIYRRRLFQEVRYPEDKVFEDVFTLPQLLRRATKVATTSQGLYVYRENPEGITSRAGARETAMLLEGNIRSLRMLIPGFGTPEMKRLPSPIEVRQFYMHVVDIQLRLAELQAGSPLLPSIKVSLHGLSPIHKLKAVAINSIGLDALCCLNRQLRRLVKRR